MGRHVTAIFIALLLGGIAGFGLTPIGAWAQSPNMGSFGGISPMRPDLTRPGGLPGAARDIAPARTDTGAAALPESKRKSAAPKKSAAKKKKSKSAKAAAPAAVGIIAPPESRSVTGVPDAAKGSPQPDPPLVALPSTPTIPPAWLKRFEDRAAALIQQLLENPTTGGNLPQRQPRLPGDTPPFEITKQQPGTGRGTTGWFDPSIDSGPPAAGGKVRDPRGQAGGDWVWDAPVESRINGTRRTEVTGFNTRTGQRLHHTFTLRDDKSSTQRDHFQNGDGSSETITEERDAQGNTTAYTHNETKADGTLVIHLAPTIITLDRKSGDPKKPEEPEKKTGQPAPTDDYRRAGNDNCHWVPGVGCTFRRTAPRDMTGQPGRGDRGDRPVANLPNTDQVTNPVPIDGREGPVGFRAPQNPGGPSEPDPARGGGPGTK